MLGFKVAGRNRDALIIFHMLFANNTKFFLM